MFAFVSVVGFLVLVAGLTDLAGMLLAMTIVSALATLRWAARDTGGRTARRQLRLALEHSGSYVLPEDLDRTCQDLLRRTQDATESVLASRVNQAGLIDTIDNRVTLPEETWRIACRLARLTAMNAEHHRIVPRDLPTEVAEAFQPYTAALNTALGALTARVQALEEYAWRVYQADRVYRAHQQLEVLSERAPDYHGLLADILSDQHAVPHIGKLADQAEHVNELFRQSIHDARLAATHLLASRDPAPDGP
jgi:hypothetical protein